MEQRIRGDVEQRIRALVARHRPGREVGAVTRLGEGLENLAYEVDGELIVRFSKEPDPVARAGVIGREVALLDAVAGISSLPVPEVVFADATEGVLAYLKLPGRTLLDPPPTDPLLLAPALGRFLGGLHRAPVARFAALVPRDLQPPAGWRDDAEELYAAVAASLSATARRHVEDFLGRTPPAGPTAPVFCHNDLGAEHILVEGNRITGVIDWTDAAIADPAYDLGLILRDLGPDALARTLAGYEAGWDDAAAERAVFYARCALLEDLAYGLEPGRQRYGDLALAHFGWTFG